MNKQTSVTIDNQRSLELMRTIATEADSWNPEVTIKYEPAEAMRGASPFVVTLNVKAYRRHDRRRVTRGRTPEAALEIALAEMRMAKD